MEKECDKGAHAGNGSTEASAAGKEGGKPGQSLEEESDEDEGPSKAPHVVVVIGGSVAAVATDEGRGRVLGVASPSLAEGRARPRRTAIMVAAATEPEISPLSDVAGASDTRGVGAKEIGVTEGRGIADAR